MGLENKIKLFIEYDITGTLEDKGTKYVFGNFQESAEERIPSFIVKILIKHHTSVTNINIVVVYEKRKQYRTTFARQNGI